MPTNRTRFASNLSNIETATRVDTDPRGVLQPGPQMASSPRPIPRVRRVRRRGRLLTVALAASSAVGLVSADHVVVAEERPTVQPRTQSAEPANLACRGLWDRILVLGIPEAAWSSAAKFLGFAQSGEWLSADGLTWEHIDGQLVTVATPRTSNQDQGTGCNNPVAEAGRSRS